MSSVATWPEPQPTSALRDRWHLLCIDNGVPIEVAERTWGDLAAAYNATTRRYHTLEHIGEVLAWVDRLARDASLALQLAAWLHDVVYDATASENEAASATWLRANLATHLDRKAVDRAADLIVMTAGHDPDVAHGDATVLADADLAILGAPPERYRRYATDVRAEYVALDTDAWASGRRRVLESMLARGRLYHHATMRPLEEQARRNLASELASLDRPGASPPQPGRA